MTKEGHSSDSLSSIFLCVKLFFKKLSLVKYHSKSNNYKINTHKTSNPIAQSIGNILSANN